MSKKNYQAIAKAIYQASLERGFQGVTAAAAFRHVAVQLAEALAADNPRFDRGRFLEACETGKTRGMRQVV